MSRDVIPGIAEKNRAAFLKGERVLDEMTQQVIRRLFEIGGSWRDYAIDVDTIVATVGMIRRGTEKDRIRRALRALVREKLLRARMNGARRLYEAVLTQKEIES